MRRLLQVFKYGWRDGKYISKITNSNVLIIFMDILFCFFRYRMWSSQYKDSEFYNLNKEQRKIIGKQCLESGIIRDKWQTDFRNNRKFLIKYSDKKYEKTSKRDKRRKAYTKKFNAGDNLQVEYDVNISRQHYLNGEITIGNNVLLAKHVFIDYSGGIEIGDNVQLTNGVIIETHRHPFHSDYRESRKLIESTPLKIEEGVVLGSRSIIMPSCNKIGKYARIGAGAVVTRDIPDYAVAVGVPAKVIRFQIPK